VKPLTDFLTRLNPMVPGCPEPVALQALLDTAVDFCDRTMVVQHTTDPTPVVPGVATYDLDTPSGTTPARVLAAWYDGARLDLAPLQTVTARSALGAADALGTPRAAYVLEPATVRLFPAPDTTQVGTLQVRVATRPLRAARHVDDALFDDWVEAIVGGALARLAIMPGMSFSNPDMAVYGAGLFGAGVSAAKLEARKGRVVGDVHVRLSPFSGVRR
jgi:hypothetical protein